MIYPMRVWLNYMWNEGWFVHCLASDARTVISPHVRVAKDSTLLGLLRVVGADEETLQKVPRDLKTGRGTIGITVTEKGRKLLQIAPVL
jgi:hypothetical protein